jgi:hypothetical protein
MSDKKGQITIFVVVGIVIVVGILVLFYLMKGAELLDSVQTTPENFIQSCVEDSVEDSMIKIFKNGGEIESSFNVMYNGEPYNYLCHTGDNYVRCYNLHPMLELQIEKEIKDDTVEAVGRCFEVLREDFENRGFDVEEEETVYSIDLLPGSVDVNLEKDIVVSRGSSSQSYSDFDLRIVSPLYELVKITKTILTSESRFCAFERNGFMIFYPEYDIKMINYDNNKIYRVIDRNSGNEFKFAVRACAVPAGI